MATKKGRRTRSPHPGVVLARRKRADGPDRWRAKWTDPDSGRIEWLTLDAGELGLTSAEARKAWAVNKSKALQARRAEIAAGAARLVPSGIAEAIESYLKAKEEECRPTTVSEARAALGRFTAWLPESVRSTKELTPPVLAAFRDHVLALRRTAPASRGPRGGRRITRRPLSAETKNKLIAHVGACLREWRRRKMVRLTSDDIGDALRRVKPERSLPNFLSVAKLRKLLKAALRHDREMFTETRAEHRGDGEIGATPRYEPAAPFILFALVTAMRRGEAEGLPWSEVDLDGETITLTPDRVKTRHGRLVDLALSPSLVALLRALRLRSGGEDLVFPAWAAGNLASSTRKRLAREFGAEFSWQALRRTASTFTTNWNGAGPWVSAKRCGHSVTIAEKSYAGLVTVDPSATTLEEAMGIADLAEKIVQQAGGDVAAVREA